jgi:hypothetical protein
VEGGEMVFRHATYESRGVGWKTFIAIIMILAGTFNVLDGLRGVTNASQVESHFPNGRVQLPITNSVKTWSWVILIVGVVMIIAGFLIAASNMIGRIVGVIAAGVNAVLQLGYIDHDNFWSFTIILIDILIIYGIVVHGGPADE